MALSDKQADVLVFMRENGGKITLEQAVRLVGRNIYHNKAKYVRETLTRMVNRGMIRKSGRSEWEEIKPAEYKGPPAKPIKCKGNTLPVLPGMEEWARARGLIN